VMSSRDVDGCAWSDTSRRIPDADSLLHEPAGLEISRGRKQHYRELGGLRADTGTIRTDIGRGSACHFPGNPRTTPSTDAAWPLPSRDRQR
jgi:hypothetical protein